MTPRAGDVNTTVVKPAEPSLRWSLPFYAVWTDYITIKSLTSSSEVVMIKHLMTSPNDIIKNNS